MWDETGGFAKVLQGRAPVPAFVRQMGEKEQRIHVVRLAEHHFLGDFPGLVGLSTKSLLLGELELIGAAAHLLTRAKLATVR